MPIAKPGTNSRWNTAWLPCALTVLATMPFVAIRIVKSDCDLSQLVCAADVYCDVATTPAGLFIGRNSDGYDGQFFYRIALNPFTAARTEFGITLDRPAYRHSRILYPLLAWTLSLGRPLLLPFWLLTLNIIGLAAIGWLAGALARTVSQHAIWGLLISLYPGFLLTVARDTSEILSVCGLLGATLALQRGRNFVAAIVLSLAVLTRETNLGLAIAVGIVAAFQSLRGMRHTTSRRAWLPAILPVATYAAWQFVLWKTWGVSALHESGDNLGRPFDAFLLFVQRAFIPFRGEARTMAVQLALFFVVSLAALLAMRHSTIAAPIRVAWWLFALLAACLGDAVWGEDWAYLRALTELYIVGAVITLAAPAPLRRIALAIAVVAFIWTAHFHRNG